MSIQLGSVSGLALDERARDQAADLYASPKLDFSLNRLFYRSDADRPPLRVGVMLNGARAPLFMRKVLEDIRACNFAELICVVENAGERAQPQPEASPAAARLARSLFNSAKRKHLLYYQYLRAIDRRYRTQPDPVALADCSDLLAGAERIPVQPLCTQFVDRFPPEAIEQIRAMNLDVLLRFGFRIIRGDILHTARHGVWSFHHGDSERYRGGPPLLWELMEGSSTSGAVLQRLEDALDAGPVLQHANLATCTRPSVSANRFNVYWTTQHFVIQKLNELHRFGPEHLEQRTIRHANYLGKRRVYRTPENLDMVRWLTPTMARSAMRRSTPSGGVMHWRIGVRRTTPALYEATPQSKVEFTWLDSPRGRYWADPFLLEEGGATWLFFEDYDYAAKRGAISCGKFENGAVTEVRKVLEPGFHLSYPHVFKHDGAVWMIPESLEAGAVQLYRARRFPDEWALERTLIDLRAVDATPFHHDDRWWMFVSPMVVNGHAPLTLLFSAPQLTGPWTLHRNSPIAADVRWARSGGAIFSDGERLLRPSQDCSIGYGYALSFNEIIAFTENRYQERRVLHFTPDRLTGIAGVHTYNRTAQWEVIDGRGLLPAGRVL